MSLTPEARYGFQYSLIHSFFDHDSFDYRITLILEKKSVQ